MRKILVFLLTVSLFSIQQNSLYAQTDTPSVDDSSEEDDPELAPPETLPSEDESEDDMPTGEPAPVEESDSGGGSSGGAFIVIGAVAVVWAVASGRNKLEKTFTTDSVTGSSMNRLSGVNKNKLEWSIDYGSLAHDSLYGFDKQPNQQVFNWSIGRTFESTWKVNSQFGFAYDTDVLGEADYRQWASAEVNKSNLFKSDDRLSLSVGQRDSRDITNNNYISTVSKRNFFDLQKNAIGNGRYMNLSYLRPMNDQSLMAMQLHYNAKQSQAEESESSLTVNWQYRY